MNKKVSILISLLNNELRIFLGIGFGVFLFVLFFQPFPLEVFDINNSLLFVAGQGAIVFLFMAVVRVLIPWLVQSYSRSHLDYIMDSYLSGMAILTLNSLGFAFYLHYVGFVDITFFIMFKIVLICLAPVVVLSISDKVKKIKLQNESLSIEKKTIQKEIEKYEQDYHKITIEFISEKSSENLTLLIQDIAFIRSADNYVEIIYREGNEFKNKLIRNSLKNIEQQLRPYGDFIRCHRICIVNVMFIEKLNRNISNHWLTIKGFDVKIPVSRQYLLRIKEAI